MRRFKGMFDSFHFITREYFFPLKILDLKQKNPALRTGRWQGEERTAWDSLRPKPCIRGKQQGQLQGWEVEQAVHGTGTKGVAELMHGLPMVGYVLPEPSLRGNTWLKQLLQPGLSQCLGSVPIPTCSQEPPIVLPSFHSNHCFVIQLRERQRRKKRINVFEDQWLRLTRECA